MKFGKILTFFSRVKHLDQNWHFDYSEHGKDEILQNLEIFSRSDKFGSNWELDHLGPGKDEIWLNPEILSCLENLAQN